jgi:hypothetical protein
MSQKCADKRRDKKECVTDALLQHCPNIYRYLWKSARSADNNAAERVAENIPFCEVCLDEPKERC